MTRGRIGILINGRGSNMLALAETCRMGAIAADVAVVISNQPDAPGLKAAALRGIETLIIDHRAGSGRAEHDARLAEALKQRRVDLVCLAGYMRLLSPDFIREFPNRIVNVHPALLPSFPGLHAQRQALAYGVRVTGVTVHFVDEGLDAGPIILQRTVSVFSDDTEESLSERILQEEHRTYPEAVRLFFEGRLRVEGRRVRITD
jgi:phosphoribosylglycinamide formyltransferase-1